MPLNSSDMGLVPIVGQGTIEPTTAMADGFASVAVNPLEAHYQALLQSEAWNQLGTTMPQYYTHQETVDMAFQQNVSSTSQNLTYQFQQLYGMDSSTPVTSTNSSMNTKTKKVKPAAYKPVTLTLTGQLKPSTLTKVPPAKSPRSTKVTLGSISEGW